LTKKKIDKQQNTYQGVVVDVSDISDELTDRAKRFVFWYCFPGSDSFQNKKRAAIAAGYAPRNASTSGYKLCKNPQVIKEIERVSKSHSTEAINTLYRKYINSLEVRAFFDPADYIAGADFKPIEEIAPEKRVCLEQAVIDMKGGKIMGYEFGSRRAAMAEIRELHAKEHYGDGDNGEEETREIILERIAIREARRAQIPPELKAEIVEEPEGGLDNAKR
jgi:hypothetical protein